MGNAKGGAAALKAKATAASKKKVVATPKKVTTPAKTTKNVPKIVIPKKVSIVTKKPTIKANPTPAKTTSVTVNKGTGGKGKTNTTVSSKQKQKQEAAAKAATAAKTIINNAKAKDPISASSFVPAAGKLDPLPYAARATGNKLDPLPYAARATGTPITDITRRGGGSGSGSGKQNERREGAFRAQNYDPQPEDYNIYDALLQQTNPIFVAKNILTNGGDARTNMLGEMVSRSTGNKKDKYTTFDRVADTASLLPMGALLGVGMKSVAKGGKWLKALNAVDNVVDATKASKAAKVAAKFDDLPKLAPTVAKLADTADTAKDISKTAKLGKTADAAKDIAKSTKAAEVADAIKNMDKANSVARIYPVSAPTVLKATANAGDVVNTGTKALSLANPTAIKALGVADDAAALPKVASAAPVLQPTALTTMASNVPTVSRAANIASAPVNAVTAATRTGGAVNRGIDVVDALNTGGKGVGAATSNWKKFLKTAGTLGAIGAAGGAAAGLGLFNGANYDGGSGGGTSQDSNTNTGSAGGYYGGSTPSPAPSTTAQDLMNGIGDTPTPNPQGDISQGEEGTGDPTVDSYIDQLMSSYQPYLDSQFAAIDAQCEADIVSMREQLAARGIYNSDLAVSLEQKIRTEASQQKQTLYAQVLSEAYSAAMDYAMQEKQLAQDQAQFAAEQQYNANKDAADMELTRWLYGDK